MSINEMLYPELFKNGYGSGGRVNRVVDKFATPPCVLGIGGPPLLAGLRGQEPNFPRGM